MEIFLFFGVEHSPYHRAHVKIAERLVCFYKGIKSGAPIDRDELSLFLANQKEISSKRFFAAAQNILVKCSDFGYRNPGIVCGAGHIKELKSILGKRGYSFEIYNDYNHILEKNRKRTDYAIRMFSVPLIENRKI